MQQKKQRPDQDLQEKSIKGERVFPVLIAALSIVSAILAAAIMLFGPTIAPSHYSASIDATQPQTLVNAAPGSVGLRFEESESRPDLLARNIGAIISVPAQTPALPRSTESQVTVQSPEEDNSQIASEKPFNHAEAKRLAKRQLAKKLAQLNLSRSLAATRETVIPSPDVRELVAKAREPRSETDENVIVTASLPSSREFTGVVSDVTPELEEQTQSLSGNIEDPLEFLVPVPGSKPEPPARPAPAVTERTEDKPAAVKPVLAYATPGNPEENKNGAFGGIGKLFSGRKGGLPGRGSGIAVYDISAATVHMPDGTKLVAHSGIGHRMDNPKYAHVRNLGPTPPNIYDLRMRERRFHGVEAIRMLPRDLAAMKGRDGMLAHSPLLRRSKGSHGCVAFKDYDKFLKAFKAGKVKKMIVVPSMDKLPKYMAALNRGAGA